MSAVDECVKNILLGLNGRFDHIELRGLVKTFIAIYKADDNDRYRELAVLCSEYDKYTEYGYDLFSPMFKHDLVAVADVATILVRSALPETIFACLAREQSAACLRSLIAKDSAFKAVIMDTFRYPWLRDRSIAFDGQRGFEFLDEMLNIGNWQIAKHIAIYLWKDSKIDTGLKSQLIAKGIRLHKIPAIDFLIAAVGIRDKAQIAKFIDQWSVMPLILEDVVDEYIKFTLQWSDINIEDLVYLCSCFEISDISRIRNIGLLNGDAISVLTEFGLYKHPEFSELATKMEDTEWRED
jgi:hypothetical protein